DGLSGNKVTAVFQDREGDIWVGTTHGLDRFREFAVATLAVKQGLDPLIGSSVLGARDGSLWVSTAQGFARLKNGQVSIYQGAVSSTKQAKVATTAGSATANLPLAEKRENIVQSSGLPAQPGVPLFEDGAGRIWLSTVGGVGYLEHDRFTSV